ncbi:hypothetical protein J5N97_005539 [Dioscorea zingiberensis]|uniref:Protein kinase domain-containing protein n=1 Tax=Dioscorea zingiberensis TaxID=325984 RepID=A0A9D5HSC8_9LILI|nr:hypothetical protein J5N97_005539 [Dioscorea zingiberensis]
MKKSKKAERFMESFIRTFTRRQERANTQKEEEDGNSLEAIAVKEQKVFRYETLATATHDFNPRYKLGEGGYGPVFKGKLGDGREVAVKRLGRGSTQGKREFSNEAMLLSQVQHKNVVNLYGYCVHGDDKLLVYEYVPNESLDKLLFSKENKNGELDWKRRYDVINGVARGLLYLHEDAHTTIIHRDIKAANILLDEKWTPKIADFGLARLYPEDQTHVNTRVAGTTGYMAPEYVMHGLLSTKADVFSYGVLVLELITGQKNSSFTPRPHGQSLREWAWKLYKKGQSLEMIDPDMRPSAVADQITVCVQVGLLCTQPDPKLRPDMNRVMVILSKKSSLDELSIPGITGSTFQSSYWGESYSSSTFANASSSKASTAGSVSTSLSQSFTSSSNASTSNT